MISKINLTKPKVLVLMKGVDRYIYRFTPGSEGTVLACLLRSVRDPANNLSWSDMLPVLVRLRDYLLCKGGTPIVIHKINAAA